MTMDTRNLNQNVDSAGNKMKAWRNEVATASKSLTDFTSTARHFAHIFAGIFVTGHIARGIHELINFGDELGKLGTRLRVSVNELAELQFVSERSGVAFEGVSKSIQIVQKNLLDFRRGTGEAKDDFKALGITLEDAERFAKNPIEAFYELGQAIGNIEESGRRLAVAQRIFGKSGAESLQIFSQTAEQIKALRERQRELTGDLEGFAKKSEEAKDAFADVSAAGKGLLVAVLEPLLPSLTGAALALTDFIVQLRKVQFPALVRDGKAFIEMIDKLTDTFLRFFTSMEGKLGFFGLIRNGFLEIRGAVIGLSAALEAVGLAFDTIISGNFEKLPKLWETLKTVLAAIDKETKEFQRGKPFFGEDKPEELQSTRKPDLLGGTTIGALDRESELRNQAAIKKIEAQVEKVLGNFSKALELGLESIALEEEADHIRRLATAVKEERESTLDEAILIEKKYNLARLQLQEEYAKTLADDVVKQANFLKQLGAADASVSEERQRALEKRIKEETETLKRIAQADQAINLERRERAEREAIENADTLKRIAAAEDAIRLDRQERAEQGAVQTAEFFKRVRSADEEILRQRREQTEREVKEKVELLKQIREADKRVGEERQAQIILEIRQKVDLLKQINEAETAIREQRQAQVELEVRQKANFLKQIRAADEEIDRQRQVDLERSVLQRSDFLKRLRAADQKLEQERQEEEEQRQIRLGERIVFESTRDLQAPFEQASQSLRVFRVQMETAFVGLERHSDDVQRAFRADIALREKELELIEKTAQLKAAAGTNEAPLLEAQTQLIRRQIQELKLSIEELPFHRAEAAFRNLGAILNNTIDEMVRGLLRGTQTITELWNNLLLNTMVNLISRATQNLITNIFSQLAATEFGRGIGGLFAGALAAHGGATRRFAIGGHTFGPGPGDIIPALLSRNEGIVNPTGMDILDQLNKGKVPKQLMGRETLPPINIIVEYHNPIDPRVWKTTPGEIVNVVINDARVKGGAIRQVFKEIKG